MHAVAKKSITLCRRPADKGEHFYFASFPEIALKGHKSFLISLNVYQPINMFLLILKISFQLHLCVYIYVYVSDIA